MKLYSFSEGTCSARIHIYLRLKNIDIERVNVDLFAGQHNDKEFSDKNPRNLVPVLEVDGVHLIESYAILNYLEERFPSPELLPSDPIQKAKVKGIMQVISSGIQPYQNLRFLGNVGQKIENFDSKAFVTQMMKYQFKGLDALVKQTAGKFTFGDELTLADVYLYPQVQAAKNKFNVELAEFPHLERIYENLGQLDESKI